MPLRNWDQLKSIVEPLPEWRNTSNRGFQCEKWAIEALKEKSVSTLFHHCRCAYVEVDVLAFRAPQEIWVVEVKSSGFEEFHGARLNFKQLRRLQRVALQLVNNGFDVQVVLALVSGENDIHWFEAFSLEPIDF